jgi:hypothetical protein
MSAVRSVLALLTGAVLAAFLAGAALGMWSATGSGSAAGAARTMPTGGAPTARVSGTDVVVTWPAATIASGVNVEGYVVRRYDANGNAVTAGASCSGTVTALTCTEHGVVAGTWTYTDTPVQEGWTGGESPPSAAVLVPGG